MAFFRRVVDAFLRTVTPPRRDYTFLPPEEDGGWPDHGETAVIYRALLAGRFARIDPDEARRLGYWPGQEHRPDFVRAFRERGDDNEAPFERPWNFRWDRVAKRSAGPGFSREEYRLARERSREVARRTLGEEQWRRFERDGYLDVRSHKYPGISYRLRVGRRVEIVCDPGVRSPWYYDFLCINPVYPLPEYEFFAQLYLYCRDMEDEIGKVAAPQPWDQALGRTF
ncbi:MAG TPA: hypothetical protein VKV26_04850 [Dehalococcoidia bacterium]|nr:hypothetical protein [Dehalococcoidia bacterium]